MVWQAGSCQTLPLLVCRSPGSRVKISLCLDLAPVAVRRAKVVARRRHRAGRSDSRPRRAQVAAYSSPLVWRPVIAATARRCTRDKLFCCALVMPPLQTGLAYDNRQRPSLFQKVDMVTSSTPSRFILRRSQIFFDAFFTICSTWAPHLRSSCMRTPSIFSVFMSCKGPEGPKLNSGEKDNVLLLLKTITKLLFVLLTKLFCKVSLWNLFSSCWRTFSSGFKHCWVLSW